MHIVKNHFIYCVIVFFSPKLNVTNFITSSQCNLNLKEIAKQCGEMTQCDSDSGDNGQHPNLVFQHELGLCIDSLYVIYSHK